jgi:transcriptional regulator with XRE-family HTH domain
MDIGARIRRLREQKGLSQGDLEEATGMLRCYTSRVENGHTIPSITTLERYASALQIPLSQLLYDTGFASRPQTTPKAMLEDLMESPGAAGVEGRFLSKLWTLLETLNESDRELWISVARKLSRTKS